MGYLVVSLDFELLWGVHNHETKESFNRQTEGARKAIPALLQLFDKYDIHATWGTVGMLMAENKEQIEKFSPKAKPSYIDKELSAYNHFDTLGDNESEDIYHYAKSLVDEIGKYSNQEIGSHTFSHYYCKAEGQTLEEFESDLNAAQAIAEETLKKPLESLIFPRNNFIPEYAEVAYKCGFKCVRSNPKSFVYNSQSYFARLLRLIDMYFNVCGMKCAKPEDCKEDGFVAIPASRFFRKYNKKLSYLEPLKVACIKRQMKYAAKHDRIFHIWWHPHNISRNTDKLLEQLENIFKYSKELERKYGLTSLNMAEMAEKISEVSYGI